MSEEKKNKVWKQKGIFNTYEKAALKKASLLKEGDELLLVKIKRYGQDYTRFQVKCWHPDFVQSTNNKNKKRKRNKKK